MLGIDELETAVLRLDSNDRVIELNSSAAQCLAIKQSRLHGMAFSKLEGVPASLSAAVKNARDDHRTRRLHECRMAGGPYDCSIRLMPDECLLLEFHDLNWNRQHDQLKQLEVQTGLLELLRRNLGHEIRNPLGGIRGAAQLMASELADHDLGEMARMIMREVDRIDELIKRFWQPELHREPFDLHRCLEEALELLESESFGAVELQRDYDPSIPDLEGDASAIRQILLNLARNAFQSGATHILARTRVEHGSALLEKSRGMIIRLDFEDNGEGVPERLRPLLFLPMVTGRREGTGLGLAVAQQIASDHGGMMSYKPLGQGSRFSLRLPAGEVSNGQ